MEFTLVKMEAVYSSETMVPTYQNVMAVKVTVLPFRGDMETSNHATVSVVLQQGTQDSVPLHDMYE
jgi:hypothetical protein